MPRPQPRHNEQINPFFCRLELARRGWTIDRWAAEMHYRQRATPYLSRVLGYCELIGSTQGRRFAAVLGDEVRGDRLDRTLHELWDLSGRPPVLPWYEGVVGATWPAKLDATALGSRLVRIGLALASTANHHGATASTPAHHANAGRLKLVPKVVQRPGFRRTA